MMAMNMALTVADKGDDRAVVGVSESGCGCCFEGGAVGFGAAECDAGVLCGLRDEAQVFGGECEREVRLDLLAIDQRALRADGATDVGVPEGIRRDLRVDAEGPGERERFADSDHDGGELGVDYE